MAGIGLSSAAELPKSAVIIPQQGNTFVTECAHAPGQFPEQASEIIDTYTGSIKSWSDPATTITLYFKVGKPGKFTLWAEGTAGNPADKSTVVLTLGKQKKQLKLAGGAPAWHEIGTFEAKQPGYVKIEMRGTKKTGATFGNIVRFAADGPALTGENHFIPEDKLSDCYWFRRGPSVHMLYTPPAENIEYFYNEVTVPEGQDVNGTYFMLTGFGEGYMGIQSIQDENGENANLILFSVWSPYNTDNPGEIPDSLHVVPIAHGKDVLVRDFGNEGSGKQSMMHYPWKAGETYRTMVKVTPDGKGNTIYTGYFCDEKGDWHLLSRLLRPATNTYYRHMHSFLECFRPETSTQTRSVLFKNQWVRTADGEWHEVLEGTFTCDNTGLSGVRTDLQGGLVDDAFMLRNCGFFNETTPYRSKFVRKPSGKHPVVDFDFLESLTSGK